MSMLTDYLISRYKANVEHNLIIGDFYDIQGSLD